MNKWVLLDRDGVINQDSADFIKSAEEWQPVPGSLEAIALLSQAGFRVGVATNQSGIARKLFSLSTLTKIHSKMTEMIIAHGGRIDAIAFCPHGPHDGCYCRKPNPGLLRSLAKEHEFTLKGVPYIGDSLRDIEAAQSVNALPILVLSGKGAATLEKNAHKLQNILVFEDLLAAATFLTQQKSA